MADEGSPIKKQRATGNEKFDENEKSRRELASANIDENEEKRRKLLSEMTPERRRKWNRRCRLRQQERREKECSSGPSLGSERSAPLSLKSCLDLFSQPETKIRTCCCSWFLLLPQDIMADILSRLPSKSIAKFRCACKQLPSLTYDPHFLISHHERSSSYMIIGKSVRYGEIKLYDGNLSIETSYKFNLGRVDYKLSNFVDGLTCAYSQSPKSDIYLFNPTTREIQKIPKKDDHREHLIDKVVSLCFDMTIGHYKIVRFVSQSYGLHIYCEIYDVGRKQWRRVCECPFEFFDVLSYPVFVHGALHWVEDVRGRRRCYEKELKGIFKFNIKDERFESTIPLPYPSSSHMSVPCLMESAGNLWVAFHNRIDGNFEIWTTKDYLNDTLVMEYKFNINSLPSLHARCRFEGIVNGEVLLKLYRSELGKWHVGCYPDNGLLPRLFALEKPDESFAIYRESLISPMKLLKASRRCQKKG